jgi:hypothetical protein
MANGGLGIFDPKAQFETQLIKLMIKGSLALSFGEKPWKDLL